jgi:hypothetical protein
MTQEGRNILLVREFGKILATFLIFAAGIMSSYTVVVARALWGDWAWTVGVFVLSAYWLCIIKIAGIRKIWK